MIDIVLQLRTWLQDNSIVFDCFDSVSQALVTITRKLVFPL